MKNTFPIGFEVPLSRDPFRRALKVGHGRALLHVERHGAREVREDILEAATTCKVHDPQVEGLRADWLAELCLKAELVDSLVERVPAGTSYDRRLRCALLKEFASRGHDRARTALYEACVRDETSSEVFGCYEILELDGESGLVFVARTLGRMLEMDTEFWVDDFLLRAFDDQHGKDQAVGILEKHAPDDVAVRRFLDAVTPAHVPATRPRVRGSKTRRSSDEIVQKISTEDSAFHGGPYWGRHASVVELEPLVRIALSDAAPLVLENALRCLSGSRALPFEPRLLDLLEHENARVRMFCARTLGHHVEPRIRTAGLSALNGDLDVAVTLLRLNAVADDGPRIAAQLHPLQDPHDQHAVVSSLVHLLEDNRDNQEPLLALYIYEHSPCMNCRSQATRWLRDANACPSWLLAEGIRDASGQVREICSGKSAPRDRSSML